MSDFVTQTPSGDIESRVQREGSFLRNAFALISGTVASQALIFLCAPLLSRIFNPADFGNLANYNAWVSLLGLLSNLRYEHALIVTDSRTDQNRVLALALSLTLVSVGVYSFAAGTIFLVPTSFTYIRGLHPIVLVIPIGVLVGCLVSLLNVYNTRMGKFKAIALIAVVQVFATIIAQILFGVLKLQHALVFGALVGSMVACVLLVVLFLRENHWAHVRNEMRWIQLRQTAFRYRNFPRYTLFADAIGVLIQQFIPVLLLGLFDPRIAGLYAFSIRIVRVPLLVVSAAVSTVLRKDSADLLRAGKSLRQLCQNTVLGLAAIAFIPFLILLLFGQSLFTIVFGANWNEAGRIVQILSPGIFLESIALPLLVFFLVTGRQHYTLRVQALGLVLLLAALILGRYGFHNFDVTCALITASMIATNGLTIILALRLSRRHFSPLEVGLS